MTAQRLLQYGIGLLGVSLVLNVVLATSVISPAAGPVGLGFVLAGWFVNASTDLGALLVVAGLVLRVLRPELWEAESDEPPAIDHYS